MIHINLLPVREIIRRNKAKKQLITLLVAFFILVGALAAFAYVQSAAIKEKNNTLTKLQQEKQRYAKILQQIKKLEADKKVLETRIQVIDNLKESSSLTVHALDEIARITPTRRMWLTSLAQNGGSLTLKGMALDNRTIAKFMDDLKESPYINGVNLASSSLKSFAGSSLKEFSISCSIAVPKQEEPSTTTNQ